jgi:hypothetical protein
VLQSENKDANGSSTYIQPFLSTRTPIVTTASAMAGSMLQNANTHQYKLQSHSSNKKYERRTDAME